MHTLIVGVTESGKTTLGKILAAKLQSAGKTVLVLDPNHDSGWACAAQVSSIEAFDKLLRSNRGAFGFVDESGSVFNEGMDRDNAWWATKSRHYGHSLVFMAQRAIQVPKTMRDQCHRLALFTSSRTDGEIHAEEWNNDTLRSCNALPRLHFYYADHYDKCERMQITSDYKDYERATTTGGPIHLRHDNSPRRARVPRGKVDNGKGTK